MADLFLLSEAQMRRIEPVSYTHLFAIYPSRAISNTRRIALPVSGCVVALRGISQEVRRPWRRLGQKRDARICDQGSRKRAARRNIRRRRRQR